MSALKYESGQLTPFTTPCGPDCWHQRNGYEHVVYRFYRAPNEPTWNERLWPERDESLLLLAGWERAED